MREGSLPASSFLSFPHIGPGVQAGHGRGGGNHRTVPPSLPAGLDLFSGVPPKALFRRFVSPFTVDVDVANYVAHQSADFPVVLF